MLGLLSRLHDAKTNRALFSRRSPRVPGMTIRGPVGAEIGCGIEQLRAGKPNRAGPSDCQTRHARTGARGLLGWGVLLSLGATTPRGASRGCPV